MSDGVAWLALAVGLSGYFFFMAMHFWRAGHPLVSLVSAVVAFSSTILSAWLASIPGFLG